MKRKDRIHAMLTSEELATGGDAAIARRWREMRGKAFEAERAELPPPLEFAAKKPLQLRYLAAAAAVLLVTAGAWLTFKARVPPQRQEAQLPAAGPAAQSLRAGAVVKRERRSIAVLSGEATLAELPNGSYAVAAEQAKLSFRLRQPTNLTLRHPLVTVTVTGTEFMFSAHQESGSIHLTEGRLRIQHAKQAETEMVAPAVYRFDRAHGKIERLAEAPATMRLYRFDLIDGETFFGWPISEDGQRRRVKLLGGTTRTLAKQDIQRMEPAEAE